MSTFIVIKLFYYKLINPAMLNDYWSAASNSLINTTTPIPINSRKV